VRAAGQSHQLRAEARLGRGAGNSKGPPPGSPPREPEILALMVRGTSNRNSSGPSLSQWTAKFHVGRILAKLGASGRTEAVTIFLQHGLVS
jgi:DNA-binding CsgD family transcriptional regulator